MINNMKTVNQPFASHGAKIIVSENFPSSWHAQQWLVIKVSKKTELLWAKKFSKLQNEQQALKEWL